MAVSKHLPVYRVTYDFLVFVFLFSKNLPREYKYTVGEQLKKETLDVLLEVIRANRAQEKRKKHIALALDHLETVQILFRVLHDLKKIDLKKFVAVSEQTEMAHRQLSGWLKSCE